MKVKKEITKERVEREALECKYEETQERLKLIRQADAEYKELKQRYANCERDRKKFTEQIDWLKNREEEIIKRIDLDEIDLVTERLEVYGVDSKKPSDKKPKKKHTKVPKLDLYKVQKMREKDDEEEEYEEEEEEAEEDIKSSQKQYFKEGSAVVSDDSFEREKELRTRKEQVIALLNQTYGDEGGHSDNSSDQ
jgi:hypothetical protein